MGGSREEPPLYEHHDDDAVRIALNKVAARSKTLIVRNIAYDPLKQSLKGRIFRNSALAPLPPIKARNKDVAKRVYVRPARKKTNPREAKLVGYANDIPAIALSETKSKVAGQKLFKGEFVYTRTRGKVRKGAGPNAKGRKLKKPTTGGIKVRGTSLPFAFINEARYNNKIHIFRRTSPRTWRPGESGWKYPKAGAPQKARMPIGVVRYDIHTPMKEKFQPIVNFVTRTFLQEEYDKAMGVLIGKAAAATKS